MSSRKRTNKGAKGCGYDFWGPRPNSGSGYGPYVKLRTHRMERRRDCLAVRRGDEMVKREAF